MNSGIKIVENRPTINPRSPKIGISVILLILSLLVSCSAVFVKLKTPEMQVQEVVIVDTVVIKEREVSFEEVKHHNPRYDSKKVVAITDIVKNPNVLDFLCHDQRVQRAYKVQKETGLFATVILAQKGLESAWGKSSLTRKTKNQGNIKCLCCRNSKLRKEHKKLATQGHPVCHRAYDKIEKSNDYYVSLKTNWEGWNLYRNLITKRFSKVAEMDTFQQQVEFLKKRGYATAKNYVPLIIEIIQVNNFDKLQNYIDQGYTITTSNGKYVIFEP